MILGYFLIIGCVIGGVYGYINTRGDQAGDDSLGWILLWSCIGGLVPGFLFVIGGTVCWCRNKNIIKSESTCELEDSVVESSCRATLNLDIPVKGH